MCYVVWERCDHLFWVSYIYQKLKSMKPHDFFQTGYIRVVFDQDNIVFSHKFIIVKKNTMHIFHSMASGKINWLMFSLRLILRSFFEREPFSNFISLGTNGVTFINMPSFLIIWWDKHIYQLMKIKNLEDKKAFYNFLMYEPWNFI